MSDKIQDFGEKIGGAKKDIAAAKARGGLSLIDVSGWTDVERDTYIKKDIVFPKPDYQKMVDEGIPKEVAYFIKKVRDALPVRPATDMGLDVMQYRSVQKERTALLMEKQRLQHYLRCLDKDPNSVMPGEKMLYGSYGDAARRLDEIECDISQVEDNLMKMEKAASKNAQDIYIDMIGDIGKKCLQLQTMQDCVDLVKDLRQTAYKIVDHTFFSKVDVSSERQQAALQREMKKKEFLFSKEDKAKARFFIEAYDGKNIQIDEKSKAIVLLSVPGYAFYIYNKPEWTDASKWEKGKFFAFDVKGRNLIGIDYPSPEDALSDAMDMLDGKTSRKTKLNPPPLDSIERIGDDYRNGANITSQDIIQTFRVRGGEFGNYESQNDRQDNLNMSYEALKDLAKVLGIEETDISLGGKLALAFGARGGGSALAHFEPERNVINLTKERGAGTLGHEFGHALDFYIARVFDLKTTYATGDAYHSQSPLHEVMKAIKTYQGKPSEFYNNACAIDAMHSKEDKGYWHSDVELFARAFHTYLLDKLQEMEARSDFLCGTAEFPPIEQNGKYIYTYPRGDERKAINQAFDKLISYLKEKHILHEKKEVPKEAPKKEIVQELPAEEQGVQLSFDLDMTEVKTMTAAQKEPPVSASAATLSVHCKDIVYDFVSHPDYPRAKELALQTVRSLYMDNQAFEMDEAKQMIEDGDIADISEYDGEYLEPFDPKRFEDRIQDIAIQYMCNLTNVPRNPVVTLPISDINDVTEEMLKQQVEKTYGVKALQIDTFGVAATKDMMAQKTYDTIGSMMENQDYQTFLALKASIQNYSLSNIAMIYSQKPTATAVKSFKNWSKTFDRQINKGEKALDIWCPNVYEIKTEEAIDKYLKRNEWKFTPRELDIKRQRMVKELEEKGSVHEVSGFRIGKVFDISQTTPRDPEHDKFAEINKALHPLGNIENFPDVCKAIQKVSADAGFPIHGTPKTPDDIFQSLKTYAEDVFREEPASILGIKNNTPSKGVVRLMEAEIAAYLMAKRLGVECDGHIAYTLSDALESKVSSDELMMSGKRGLFQEAFQRGAAFAEQFEKAFSKEYTPPVQQKTADEPVKHTSKTMVSLEQLFRKVRIPTREEDGSASFTIRLPKNLELFLSKLPDGDLAMSEFKSKGSIPVVMKKEGDGISVYVGSQPLSLNEKEAAAIEKRLTEKPKEIER